MKKIDELLTTIQTKSLPNLDSLYSADINTILLDIKKRLIYICENNFLYFENWVIQFERKCVTWENWFWFERWSFKTPTWLHFISDFIWDTEHKYQKFVNRLPTTIEQPVQFWEINPWIYTRILRLDWVEEKNKNTLSRWIYIHGNLHDWYWKTDNSKRSKWCIWLKVDDMMTIFDMMKQYKNRIFVYIEWK